MGIARSNTYKVAHVIIFAIVIADKSHQVVFGKVFGVLSHELLDAIPETRNGVLILVQRYNEAVFLFLGAHESEGVLRNVTEVLDVWLDSPVVIVVFQQVVAEEEAGFVATHMAVTDRAAVNHTLHFLAGLGSLVLINPRRETPVLLGYFAVMGSARRQSGRDLFEFVIEVVIVEENPVIVVIAIKSVFDLMDGISDLVDVMVTSECNEGGVFLWTSGCGVRLLTIAFAIGLLERLPKEAGLGLIGVCTREMTGCACFGVEGARQTTSRRYGQRIRGIRNEQMQ